MCGKKVVDRNNDDPLPSQAALWICWIRERKSIQKQEYIDWTGEL